MKRSVYIIILSVAILSLVLSACAVPKEPSSQTEPSPAVTSDKPIPTFPIVTSDYTIEKINDTYYLSFFEEKKATQEQIGACTRADISFSSFDEMLTSLQNNQLTNEQAVIMQASFAQNDNGIILCDFGNLYEPVLPEGLSCSSLYWTGGDNLSFAFNIGSCHFYSENTYLQLYEKNYVNFPNGSGITILNEYEENYDSLSCRWTKYSQFGNTYRIGRMDIVTDSGTLHVFLDYILRYTGSFEGINVSDTIPYMVTMYGELDGQYVRFVLHTFETPPTVEWLTSFGVTPYFDNSDHVAS